MEEILNKTKEDKVTRPLENCKLLEIRLINLLTGILHIIYIFPRSRGCYRKSLKNCYALQLLLIITFYLICFIHIFSIY